MEIRDMQFDDIEQRSAEIVAEMETEGADLDALQAEAHALILLGRALRGKQVERQAHILTHSR